MTASIFIVGCGDIGRRTARLWQAEGATVSALARTAQSAAVLHDAAIVPVHGDLDQAQTLQALRLDEAIVYYLAPPSERGDDDSRMRNFLGAITGQRPARLVYMSTTGVYGDCQGAWIREDQPLKPENARSRRRVDAEQAVMAWGAAHGVAVVILRVAGIYGPGRLPVERLRRGEPVVRAEEAPPSNRIHADDLAAVCVAAAKRGASGEVYNVADGHPTSMTEYFNRVADLLGLPPPPAISWAEAQQRLSPAMLSFLAESKRIDNRKLREKLGVTLRYPTLAHGLPASLP